MFKQFTGFNLVEQMHKLRQKGIPEEVIARVTGKAK